MQPKPVARVVDAFGKVEKKMPQSAAWATLSVGDQLPEASTLRTGESGAALLRLPDGHMVRVGVKTTVILSQLGADRRFSLKVLSGQIWSLVKKASQPARFTVETPSAVAGVTGTLFCVAVDETDQETTVSTDEGSVEVRPPGPSDGQPGPKPIAIRAGFMVRFARNRPAARLVRPMLFAALRQSPEHVRMWRLLHGEGAWARQDGRGPMQMRRGRDGELFRYLRAHRLGLPHPPPPGPGGPRGPRLR